MIIPAVITAGTEPGLYPFCFYFLWYYLGMFSNTNVKNGVVKRKSKFLLYFVILAVVLSFLFISAFALIRYFNSSEHNKFSVSYIYQKWAEHDYKTVYETCEQLLQKQPYNNAALTFKGYAGFYLAVSQTDSADARDYLDAAIFDMRTALQSAKKSLIPQLDYMLGKTYFYKNTLSSYYYYSDLVINYLSQAKELGYRADDIHEYLGLSYASLGMTSESISSFTEALLVRESGSLLLSIAEQYRKAGQNSAAKQYLYRVIKEDDDENLVVKGRILLGQILTEEGDLEAAQNEFQTILEKNINSADAYYGLGVIYEKQGDLIKARAEWRKALRAQINHPEALKKISDYK